MSRQDAPSRFDPVRTLRDEIETAIARMEAMKAALAEDTAAALDDAHTGAFHAWQDVSGLYEARIAEREEAEREPDDFDAMDEYRRAQRGW